MLYFILHKFLVIDVVYLLQFVKPSWNTFNYNTYITVCILLDLIDLKQTDSSYQNKREDSTQVSVKLTEIDNVRC